MRKLALLTLAIVLPAAHAAASPPSGYRLILSGPAAGGGRWELSADRSRLEGYPAVCLDLTPTFADGTSPGRGGGCFAGSLRPVGNVAPAAASSKSGETTTSNLVGGVATYRARIARVKFADGTVLDTRVRIGPKGWRRALGTRIRFFALDALGATTAQPRSVVLRDGRGRRVGGRRIGGP